MQKKLQDISNMVSGYNFRNSIPDNNNGDIFVLQAKDILANKDINDNDVEKFIKIESGYLRTPSFLESGDILVTSKSSSVGSFRSAVFVSDKKNILTSSSVLILKVKDPLVIPKYVSLYLNSTEGQKDLFSITTGSSYLQTILIKDLSDIKIPIPPINIQKSIIALHENIKQQELILKRKSEIKQNIISTTFTNLIS